ncbi:MAG: hypothetical protein WA952_14250, partial [Lewinella sp.]
MQPALAAFVVAVHSVNMKPPLLLCLGYLISLPCFGQDTTAQVDYPQRSYDTERIAGQAPLV